MNRDVLGNSCLAPPSNTAETHLPLQLKPALLTGPKGSPSHEEAAQMWKSSQAGTLQQQHSHTKLEMPTGCGRTPCE